MFIYISGWKNRSDNWYITFSDAMEALLFLVIRLGINVFFFVPLCPCLPGSCRQEGFVALIAQLKEVTNTKPQRVVSHLDW